MAKELRQKAREIYDYIGENLYYNLPDMEIEGEKYNSALLFSLFTALNEGRELLIGEPGLGKTTSAEYVSSIVYRLPLEVVTKGQVKGHPEQTLDMIMGGLDLGELNKGKVSVIWSSFVQLPVKTVDEINRLPEQKQNIILEGVDRGIWHSHGEILINKEHTLFSTANYEDRGTNTLTPPLRDRIDVTVESKHPGANLASAIPSKERKAHERKLKDEDMADKMWKAMGKMSLAYGTRMGELEKLCDEFGAYLGTQGIESFSRDERKKAREDIDSLQLDIDSDAFIRSVIAELSFGCRLGQKRRNESCPDGDTCFYAGYLSHDVVNCASNRLPQSIHKYAKTLAWFLGDDEVTVEHVKAVAPYALASRTEWTDHFVGEHEKDSRDDPLPIYLSKKAVEEVSARYEEQASRIKDRLIYAANFMKGGDEITIHVEEKGTKVPKALKRDEFLRQLERESHPIYQDIRRNLLARRTAG